jgi:hypothetical protein
VNVRLVMQEAESGAQLSCTRWDIAVVGKTLDDRGTVATDFVAQHADAVISVQYDPEDFSLEIDKVRGAADDVEGAIRAWASKTVLIEMTTVGFVELFLLIRALSRIGGTEISFLYVEPREYAHSRRTPLLHRRDFELSAEVPGYRGIPGAAMIMSDLEKQRAVFFLGYEERRLDRALEDFQMLNPENCSVVFGVPAFQAGWEMDAFANNIRVIRERGLSGGVFFCGAENPAAAIDVLQSLKSEFQSDNKQRLVVAPIGTKPNGLGVALFAAIHADVGLLYDHPRRKSKRTEQSSNWHLYQATFS